MTGARIHLPLVPRSARWLLVTAVLTAILVASVVRPPGAGRPVTGPFGLFPLSTWLHGVAYAGLAVVLAYALQCRPRPNWWILAVAVVLATAYGVGIELLQSTLAYRSFETGDILANAVAAALAAAGWGLFLGRVRFYRCRRLDALRPPV
jgi:VanZ family protein